MVFLQRWRESGWRDITGDEYADTYEKLGGSVVTHPTVIEAFSSLTEMPLRYVGFHGDDEELLAAVPLWGKHIAGSKAPLKKAKKNRLVDMGNPEFILPVKPSLSIELRYKGDFISSLHSDNISTLKKSEHTLSMARSYQPEQENSLSRKFKYNLRRELRLFEEAGGSYRSVKEMSSASFCEAYTSLFHRRWGFHVKGHELLPVFVEKIRDLQEGFVLFSEQGEPVAIQWILKAVSPNWVSYEYINGGVDPDYAKFSPGSVLSYLNTKTAEDEAIAEGKQLRFSFGKSDQDYKDRWGRRVEVFSS